MTRPALLGLLDHRARSLAAEPDRVHCCDALTLLRMLPDDYVDMALTSPPYDDLRLYSGVYSFDFEPIAHEAYRVLKPGGVLVWVVGDATKDGSETGTSFRQALYFMQCGFKLHDTMIYQKTGVSYPESNRYLPIFEYMFVLSKGSPKTVRLLKDRKNTSGGRKVNGLERQPDGSFKPRSGAGNICPEYGTRFNVWVIPNGERLTPHPAPFPEALARDHILSWSNPGDLILDFFMGSGTTAKMARYTKRHYIGCDISQEYVNIARDRLRLPFEPRHVKQETQLDDLPLFAALDPGA